MIKYEMNDHETTLPEDNPPPISFDSIHRDDDVDNVQFEDVSVMSSIPVHSQTTRGDDYCDV